MGQCAGVLMVGWMCTAGVAAAQDAVFDGGFDQGLDALRLQIGEGMGEVTVENEAGGECILIDKRQSTEVWSAVGIEQGVRLEPNALYRLSFGFGTDLEPNAVGWAFRAFLNDPSPVLPENPRRLESWVFATSEVYDMIATKRWQRSANPRFWM